jgi:large subunit ribosomal protein L25
MNEVTLDVDARTVTGKPVKNLRAEGIVPAVIHDHGKESVVVQAEYQALHKAYKDAGKHSPIQLTAGKQQYTALIKTVTFDPRYHKLNHVVFNAVHANEKVDAEVPVHPHYAEGNEASPAERTGLIVLQNVESVAITAVPKNLPDALHYDAEKLVQVGDHATVADLIVPAGVTIQAEPNQTIATVFEPSAIAAANDAAGGDAEAEAQAAPEAGETPATEASATKDEATSK